MIHFILTAGGLSPQYRRAITSAQRANPGVDVVLWHLPGDPPVAPCETRPLDSLCLPWLAAEIGCVVWDVLALDLLYQHGGAALPLDSISLGPVLDLLPARRDLVVSLDHPTLDAYGSPRETHPFNNVMVARQGAPVVRDLLGEAQRVVRSGRPRRWGDTGPVLLTDFVLDDPSACWAPFPALCGWEGSYIWRFYLGIERPPAETRLIHLFSSAYRDLWLGDEEAWLRDNPGFRPYVPWGPNMNADLLALDA